MSRNILPLNKEQYNSLLKLTLLELNLRLYYKLIQVLQRIIIT